jgi:hypothetical protein
MIRSYGIVMAGLDPAIPLMEARPCHNDRDRRVKPGDDRVREAHLPGMTASGYSASNACISRSSAAAVKAVMLPKRSVLPVSSVIARSTGPVTAIELWPEASP